MKKKIALARAHWCEKKNTEKEKTAMKSKKAVKSALGMSVLSIALCMAMLIGTTFAWFTDTASASVNRIQAGELKVDIVDLAGNSLNGQTMQFKDVNKNADILWEPGATFHLDSFKIVNKGNLALKYQVVVNGVNGDSKLLEAIDFTVKKGSASAALENWSGVLLPTGATNAAEGEEVGSTELITISGHMKETAGNEYQGLSIDGLGITVLATQYTYESDSNSNQYDAAAGYPDVVTVTPDTLNSTRFQSNTTYYFAPGEYGVHGEPANQLVFYELQNVTLVGMPGAKFTSLDISSIDYVNDSNPVNNDKSTLTVKGFEVTGDLMIVAADKSIVVEENKAAQITVKTNVSTKDITVNNNTLTDGEYGVYVVPNISDYDLTVTGNTFNGIQSHAIHVQGNGDGAAVTAANSITVAGNTFTSYGENGKTGRAAFKIWADTKLAPNGTDPLNDAAKALAKVIEENNTFAEDLTGNCVVADFYGKSVGFGE